MYPILSGRNRMSWFKAAMGFVDNLSKNEVVRGMVLQAANDIFIHRTDREKGYTEVKFANEGDDLEVICEDVDNPAGGYRVSNLDNHDQIETVNLTDLDDGMN